MSPDQTTLLLAGIIAGVITTLVTALVTLTTQKRAQDHEREARAQTDAEHLRAALDRFESLTNQIALNTTLTRTASMRADDAYKEANAVNQKIARLGGLMADNHVAIGAGSASAEAAYKEANSVNQKIAQLTRQVAELYGELRGHPDRVGNEERRSGEDRRGEHE